LTGQWFALSSHLGIQEFVNKKVIRVTTVDAPY